MHLAVHPVREVTPVAAVEEGADRGGIRAGRVVDRGEGDRPGFCCVFAHGAPETPVLVFGGKDRACNTFTHRRASRLRLRVGSWERVAVTR
ncbi:MAG: hypothetical protein ACK52P_06205, partial [Alphaproteobacteria bacterium]